MIRTATIEDTPRLVELGEQFVAALKYLPEEVRYNEEAVTRLVHGLIEQDLSTIIVSEIDGEVIGGLGAFILPLFFSPSVLMSNEMFFYLESSHRGEKEGSKILEEFLVWSKENGAVGTTVVSMGISGSKTYSKEIFEKYGYQRFESVYRNIF